MQSEVKTRLFFILVLVVISGLTIVPGSFWENNFDKVKNATPQEGFFYNLKNNKISYGLDLVGGTELDYRVDMSPMERINNDDDKTNDISTIEKNALLNKQRDMIEKRVNPGGVSETLVWRAINGTEEHILIQMPPDTDIQAAKRSAEQKNDLTFWAERSTQQTEIYIEETKQLLTTGDWDTQKNTIGNTGGVFVTITNQDLSKNQANTGFAEVVSQTEIGEITQEAVSFLHVPEIDPESLQDGTFSLPQSTLYYGFAKITNKETKNEEVTTPKQVDSRHILIGYDGASNYKAKSELVSRDDAKAKAEDLLQQIKNGADFEALAKENSTGPSATDGGALGAVQSGQMVPAFNDALFDATQTGLVPELVVTDFGFHIIEVLDIQEEKTENEDKEYIDFELAGWKDGDQSWELTDLNGGDLKTPSVQRDQTTGEVVVNLQLSTEGSKKFTVISTDLATKSGCDAGGSQYCQIMTKIGGEYVNSPTVRETINTRDVRISGNYTQAQAQELVDILKLGQAPFPVELASQRSISPSLGAEQLSKSIKAAIFGLIATMIFMTIMYRLPGLVACSALLIYALVYTSLVKIWPAALGGPIVLTLSGFAGVILSLGLAVDGNILIFERFKEEILDGKDPQKAIDLGFERAWPAILDSNLTTLLTCFILFIMGSTIIKGFSITLIIGVLLSMFTAIMVSRTLMRAIVSISAFQKPSYFGFQEESFKAIQQNADTAIRKR